MQLEVQHQFLFLQSIRHFAVLNSDPASKLRLCEYVSLQFVVYAVAPVWPPQSAGRKCRTESVPTKRARCERVDSFWLV